MLLRSFMLSAILLSLEIESFTTNKPELDSLNASENSGQSKPTLNSKNNEVSSKSIASSDKGLQQSSNLRQDNADDTQSQVNLRSFGNCFNPNGLRTSSPVTKKLETWNSYLDNIEPGAVVTPSTEQEVAQIIKCASQLNSTVSVESGGHSYEGYWRGNPGGVVIDLKNMNKLQMTNRGTIKVGAGSLLGPVIAKLVEESKNTQYTYALPHGLQPVLGMGGHTLGGGFGLLSRKYGLLVDKVVNIRIVDAKGKVVTVNKKENPDLFTALRGAGAGSFGIVTEFEYEYVKLPKKLTVARLTWNTSKQNFTSVWNNIMDYYNTQKDVGVTQYVNYMPGGTVEMGATFSHDSTKDQEQSYNKVISKLKPDIKVKESRGFVEAYSYYAGLAGKDGDLTIQKLKDMKRESGSRYFKGRSGYFVKPLKNKAVTDKLGALLHDNGKAGFFLLMDLWRGNILKEDCDAPTSFVHRDVLASAQIGAAVDNPESKKLAKEVYDLLKPYFPQAYQNYIDKEVPHFMTTYYGQMAQFLVDVKNTWDPTNMFKFERSIPLELNSDDRSILKTLKPTSLQGCCGLVSSPLQMSSGDNAKAPLPRKSVDRRQESASANQIANSSNVSLAGSLSSGRYSICQKISRSLAQVSPQRVLKKDTDFHTAVENKSINDAGLDQGSEVEDGVEIDASEEPEPDMQGDSQNLEKDDNVSPKSIKLNAPPKELQVEYAHPEPQVQYDRPEEPQVQYARP